MIGEILLLTVSGNVLKSARYWRLYANDISWIDPYGTAPYFQAIKEFRFYESTNCTGSNINLGYSSVSASAEYFQASQALDNNENTYWQDTTSADTSATWWKVDYGGAKTVRSIQMVAYGATTGYHSKSYRVEYSYDNSNWSTLTTFSTNNTTQTQSFNNLQ